jgi:hypothetical protein
MAAMLVTMTASVFAQLWKIDGAHLLLTTKYLLISDVDSEFKKFDRKVLALLTSDLQLRSLLT